MSRWLTSTRTHGWPADLVRHHAVELGMRGPSSRSEAQQP
jgi:hypothetical protein